MKKLLLALMALALFFGAKAQTWNYVTTSGTTFILYGLSFPPGQSDVGFACGMEFTYNADGVIVKTTDGGDNWTQILPTSGTIDGLQAIAFINDTVGYAGGWNNYFIKTTDGGTTWTNHTCAPNVWYYTDIEFWDENNGAACAYMNGGSDPCVYITSDGGDTWSPAASGVVGTMMHLTYADQNTLYAVSTTTLYKSTDGGMNWTTEPALPGLLFAVEFADANFGVIGAEEKIHYTSDGGATWGTYTTGYENFYALEVFSDGSAYVGGTDERIHVTSDFGSTWALENSGTTSSPSLYRIKYTPNGVLTTTGSQGGILQRTPLLAAVFSADNTDVCEGDVVSYTDLSPGSPNVWNWTFEGGTPATSTLQNPTVTYNTAGTYDVTLQVSNGSTSNTLQEIDYITVSAIPAQASTPSGPTSVCGGEVVDYTTSNVAGATNYIWEVDPASAGTISGTGTTATFTSSTFWSGAYVVRVKAENNCGDNGFSPDLAADLYTSPTAFFVQGGGTLCEGGAGVEITQDGSESGVDYELFLDGASTGIIIAGTGSAFSYGLVTDPGVYTAVGSNDNCNTDMYGQPYVSVLPLPGIPGIPAGAEQVCNGTSSTYTTSGSSDAEIYVWTLMPVEAGIIIPDSMSAEVSWDDSFSGTATVSVYASNQCGDSDPSELLVTVEMSPSPEIDGLALVCEDDYADYSIAETSGSTYEWEVTGGIITAGAGTHMITIHWGDPGMGYVTVTETNGDCSTTTDPYEVVIDECISIDELSDDGFRIFPNPSSTYINIECTAQMCENGFNINIWNTQGVMIEKMIVTPGVSPTKIDVSSYLSGIYFVQIITGDKVYSMERFVINH